MFHFEEKTMQLAKVHGLYFTVGQVIHKIKIYAFPKCMGIMLETSLY